MEKILTDIYQKEMGKLPKKKLLGEILKDNQFTRKIERRILSRINAIRDMANLGTHGEMVVKDDAIDILENLCKVLMWYFDKYLGVSINAKDTVGFEISKKDILETNVESKENNSKSELTSEQIRIKELEDKLANIQLQKDNEIQQERKRLNEIEKVRKENERIRQRKRDEELLRLNKEKRRRVMEEKARKEKTHNSDRVTNSVNRFCLSLIDIEIPKALADGIPTDKRFLLYSLKNMDEYIKYFNSPIYPFYAALILDYRNIKLSDEIINKLEAKSIDNGFNSINAALVAYFNK